MSLPNFPLPLSLILRRDSKTGQQIHDDSIPTKLLGLPPELLQEIMYHLDNFSLLQLASTCKHLHYQSLHAFFERNDIRAPSDGWLVAYQTPPETLWAVRAALWVKHLKQVHFYFNFGIDTLLGEVYDLYYLIKRLSSIELVKVHFSVVDSWILRNYVTHDLNVNQWFRAFTGLLDMIIEKGCTELHVTGGAQVKMLYSTPEAGDLPVRDLAQWVQESQSKWTRKRNVKNTNSPTYLPPVQEPTAPPAISTQSTQGEVPRFAEADKNRKQKFLQKLEAFWTPKRLLGRVKVKRRMAKVPAAVSDAPTTSETTKRRSEMPGVPQPEVELEATPKTSRPRSTTSAPSRITEVTETTEPVSPKDGDDDVAIQLDRDVSRLSNINIHSDMLLQPTFFPWTLSALSNASWRITNLSIKCTHIPTGTWSTLLRFMSLPHLEIFEIATDLVVCSNGAAFRDLQYFFARHWTIHMLHLQGVERLDTPPTIKETVLPDLSSVMAHPIWIISLLEMQESHPDTLSHLKSIGISTEYYQFNTPFNYELFDAALVSVGNFSGTDITLTLRFMCEKGVSSWFAEHVALGMTSSVLCRLTCVSHLVISGGFFVEIATYAKANISEWLSLFPCLQTVKFVDIAEEQMKKLGDPKFLMSIAMKCPKIKTVRIRRAVDLDELRRTGSS